MEPADTLTQEDQELISQIKRKVLNTSQQSCGAFLYPPASLEEIELAEAGIGVKLPPLIREIFLQVGNGGFGPGTGITGLLTGNKIYNRTLDDNVQNTVEEIKAHLLESISSSEQVVDVDLRLLEQDKRHYNNWQRLGLDHLIWYCDWGCNITTLVDFTKPELPIYRADGLNAGKESVETLRQWWVRWLDDSPNSR